MSDASSPIFTGMPLDRAERWRKDETWLQARLDDAASRAVVVNAQGVLLDGDRASALARVPVPLGYAEPVLLGLEHESALFAVDADPHARVVSLREAGALLSGAEAGLAAYAVALLNWHRRHHFCANCGTRSVVADAGYSRHCPACGDNHFPRLDPVVIMLVEHDGKLLLGRHTGWPVGRFSAIAGFVAPGEAVEEAVLREVLEEAGITAHSPRFVASQPWPFPSSLMLGFHAYSDGGEPVASDGELAEVRWFSLAEVNAARALSDSWGDTEKRLHLPPRVAIARFLIERWVESQE